MPSDGRRFKYAPGVLVKGKTQGEMGIVLRLLTNERIEVFLGDGLTVEDNKSVWDIVPYNKFGLIPASFSELVDQYFKE